MLVKSPESSIIMMTIFPSVSQNALAVRPYGQNKKRCWNSAAYFIATGNQIARSTLLERRHLVQAYTWQGVPLTTALTRLTLGFHARLERLWEWETLIPKVTPLPQKSHLAIQLHLPSECLLNNLRLSQALEYDTKLSPKKQAFFSKFFCFFENILIFHLWAGIIEQSCAICLQSMSI